MRSPPRRRPRSSCRNAGRARATRGRRSTSPRMRSQRPRRPARPRRRAGSWLQVLAYEPVDHSVDPLAVAVVRLAAYAFLDPARPLGVAHRALVETVDLELQPVVAQVEEVAVEEPRRLV